MRDAADAMEDHPSQFEIITAIGMLYFAESACDIVVLEVGLGGEFDATNVIDAPEVCALMLYLEMPTPFELNMPSFETESVVVTVRLNISFTVASDGAVTEMTCGSDG